mgnify:CR=1 FL=1
MLFSTYDKFNLRKVVDNMNKLTIKIDYNNLWNKEFQNYLLNLKGIINILNDKEDDEIITIKYNDDITLYIVVKEILLYLDINNIPSISYFNKHLKNKLEEYIINIEHLCCEYCLNDNIEKLLYLDGISEVYTNFDYKNKYNILVHINYDENKITKEQLLNIKYNFNK